VPSSVGKQPTCSASTRTSSRSAPTLLGRPFAARLTRPILIAQTDFILLPCDFVPPPSLALADLLDAHRSRPNATVTSLFYERAELGKDGPERILVGYEPGPPTTAATLPVAAPAAAGASNGEGTRSRRKGDRGGTLLFVRELEDTEDDVVVRLSMLRKCVPFSSRHGRPQQKTTSSQGHSTASHSCRCVREASDRVRAQDGLTAGLAVTLRTITSTPPHDERIFHPCTSILGSSVAVCGLRRPVMKTPTCGSTLRLVPEGRSEDSSLYPRSIRPMLPLPFPS